MRKIGNILFLYIFVFIMCMGASFAWYAWKGSEVSVNVNFANLDPYIKYSSTKVNGGTITPSKDYTGGISNDITFNKEESGNNLEVYGHIYLKVTSAKSDNVFKASNLKWTLVSVSNNKETKISTGNFVGESVVNDNDPSKMIPANINFNLTKESDNTTYKVYVWIDENAPMNIDISSQDISVETYAEANSIEGESSKLSELYIRSIEYSEGIITSIGSYSSKYNINGYMIVNSNTNPSITDSGWTNISGEKSSSEDGYLLTIKPNKTMDTINNICIKNSNNEVYCKSIGKYSDEVDRPTNTLCNNLTYNGSSQQLVSSTSGTGYKLKNYTGTNAGSYTITASLKDNYVWKDGTNDNVTFKCNIKQKDLTVKALDQTINYGETISQGLNKVTSTGLVEKDSIASITLTPSTTEVTDNGTITAVVSAILNNDGDDTMGNYNITYQKGKLVIKALSIENATITLNPTSYTYDGNAKKPTVTVVLNSKTLVLNTDYSVSYSNNINAGTATVTVTGKGNYTGSKSINFTILDPVYQLYNSSGTSTGYTDSLSNAISKVSSGGTIKALKDNGSDAVTIDKNVTLDTNGKTITLNGTITNKATTTIIGSGTIYYSTTSTTAKVITNSSGILTIIDSILKSDSRFVITSSSGTVNINGGTYVVNASDCSSGCAPFIPTGGTVNINGGTYQGDKLNFLAINNGGTVNFGETKSLTVSGLSMWNNSGTINFKQGTLNGVTQGIVVKDGTFNVSGGTIVASDTAMSSTSGTINITDGAISGGATGIAIGEDGSNPTLNITGGSITGTGYAGVYIGSGTVNIGTKDGNISTTSPNIYSKSYSLRNGGGTWNWYDGALYGANNPTFDKAPSGTESGYYASTISDSAYGYKTYLDKKLNITYDFNDANNVSYWNYIYDSRFNTNYDSSTQLSSLSVYGEGGWEIAYLKFSTVAGKKYTISFDYQVPSEYSALDGYSGVGYQILSGVPNDSDNLSQQIAGGNIPVNVQTTSKTISLSFTATGATTYLAFNFGMAADYKTTKIKVGKIKISVELSFGNQLGTLPNLDFGYATFNGWYINSSGGTKISNSTIPNSNTTYYAKLSPNTYKVNYYSNTNYLQGKDSVVAVISGRVFYKKYDDASLAGYLYDGTWTGPLLVGETAESVTMYATDHESCANMTPSGSFEYGGKTYYYSSSGCWYSGNFGDTSGLNRTKYVVSGGDDLNNSVKLAAQKLLADNTSSVSQSFVGGALTNLNANTYTKSNYTFKGWATSPAGNVSYTDKQAVKNLLSSGTLNLYAVWEPTTYNVNYYNNTNYLQGKDSVVAVISGRVFYKKYDDASLAGYLYDGTWTGPLLVGETAESVTMYATDHESCANMTPSGSFEYGGKTYYYSSSGCWYSGNFGDTSGLNRTKYVVSGGDDLNNSAKLAAQKLLADNTSSISQTLVYGRKIVLQSNTFSRTGYSYSGWATSPTGTVSYTNNATVSDMSSTKNLYAVWSANNYYLDLNGYLDGSENVGISGYGTADVYVNGSLVCDDCTDYYAQHPYGSTYEIKDIKAATGHTYNGVYSGSLSGTITGSTGVSLNFSTNSYTITSYYYYYYENTSWTHFDTRTDTKSYGSSFAPYNVGTPTGYSPGNNYGYYDSSYNYIGAGTVGSNSFTVTGDMIVHVHYYPNTYYVYYNANGGSGAPGATSYVYSDKGTVSLSSTTPSRSGYNFLGWSTSSSAGSPSYYAGGGFPKSTASNTTLYAVWGLPTGINVYRGTTAGYYESGTKDFLYITTCDNSNTGYCNFTAKNADATSGSIVRGNLTSAVTDDAVIAKPVGSTTCNSTSCTVYVFTQSGLTDRTASGNQIVGVLYANRISSTYPVYKTSTVSGNYRKIYFSYNTGANIIQNFTLSYYAYGAGTIQKISYQGDWYFGWTFKNYVV